MDGTPFKSQPALRGICAIGASNTHMPWMGLANECEDCNGVNPGNYGNRWTQQLEAATGWRVINRGDNGRIAQDYLGTATTRDGVLGWPPSKLPAAWLNTRARYYTMDFGGNEPGKRTTAEYRQDLSDLADLVIEQGATPIYLTLPKVHWTGDLATSWYNFDRNPTIELYNDVVRELCAERGFYLVDIYKVIEADIDLGNYDHRIRADGETLDDSLDALPENQGDPGFANWRTNIHWNAYGAGLVATAIEALITDEGLTET